MPENPPVVPLDDDDRPELRLLPVNPPEVLEVVLVRRVELLPELLAELST